VNGWLDKAIKYDYVLTQENAAKVAKSARENVQKYIETKDMTYFNLACLDQFFSAGEYNRARMKRDLYVSGTSSS
jgi:hypothetical protein